MRVLDNIAAIRSAVEEARRAGQSIGLVPTMGALHAGHESLIRRSVAECGCTVVSIFVNPTQFGPGEDLAKYPAPRRQDLALCSQLGVDLVFAPGPEEMYRPDARTWVTLERLGEVLCGRSRPTHFRGVATVVAKLLNIVRPDRAYFGEKDYQQLVVIRRMVRDLDMGVEICPCPTIREADGLACSSRNAYLSGEERRQAACLYRSLEWARQRLAEGEREVGRLIEGMRRRIEQAGPCRIDYIAVVDPESLEEVERVSGPVQLALAVRIGPARLIDNLRAIPS